MEKLIIALTELVAAGTEYLKAKTEAEKVKSGAVYTISAPVKEENISAPATALAEATAPQKRVRRTKEQIAADEAAQGVKAEEVPLIPAPATPAPVTVFTDITTPAVNPLGGSEIKAPVAPVENKEPELTEAQSYDKMVKTMGSFVLLCKNDVPDGMTQNRALLLEKYKVSKIKDLTHPQRLEVIAITEEKINNYKKPMAAK